MLSREQRLAEVYFPDVRLADKFRCAFLQFSGSLIFVYVPKWHFFIKRHHK